MYIDNLRFGKFILPRTLPDTNQYDALFSNSVFSYFPSEEYALSVLDKALRKSKYSIGLIDVHDINKEKAFEDYRRKMVDDYDERYKDLKKTFYSRDTFYDWGKKNGLEVEFYNSDIEGYWNSEFVFDVYFYKK